ncbi:RagB/SusD family nutrient uptake outer membrane protein [Aquimarina sp. TRL1]|uniref:RagB/SusD family nutrient uptake outer membrane protein n=1 Tax=Aquimarina sp. (strain TRL1) TaxID=2736252 RepID=UPI00158E57F6|nr:RagB/SusD family nutrient uptake outer membrane protein [Aquimarina sp. TRL1]QKX03993.1 RagB/SusD family nutrient uptake outer membrane protein [Aquimarina sp. TRL1]
MNIKKTIIKFSGILSVLLLISCDDNLELTPQQDIEVKDVITTEKGVKNVLIAAYEVAGSNDLLGGGIHNASELLGNDQLINFGGTFNTLRQYSIKQITVINTDVSGIWIDSYRAINQANIVLANSDVIKDEEERSRLEGEAKFIRGAVYFELIKLFGKTYQEGGQNTQPGVPLVLLPTLNLDEIKEPSRNTVEEVYTQILTDLTEAYNILPEANAEFADKYVVKALMARVYLQQQAYEEARDAANEVIQNSAFELQDNYEDAFNNPEDAREDIFAWQITIQNGRNEMNTHWAPENFGGRTGLDIAVNDEYLEIFDDSDDERRTFFYNADNGRRASTKWQEQYANVPFIRLAELYLIRAEANERLGTTEGDSPLNDINRIRTRANAAELTAITLDDILLERQRELAFEGFALHDLKRLGGSVDGIDANDDKLVLPIPQREMDANPNLTQNPGY